LHVCGSDNKVGEGQGMRWVRSERGGGMEEVKEWGGDSGNGGECVGG